MSDTELEEYKQSYAEEWIVHIVFAVVAIPMNLWEGTCKWWRDWVLYRPKRRVQP